MLEGRHIGYDCHEGLAEIDTKMCNILLKLKSYVSEDEIQFDHNGFISLNYNAESELATLERKFDILEKSLLSIVTQLLEEYNKLREIVIKNTN